MKPEVQFGIWLAIFALYFGAVQTDSAFVTADSGEEVEALNPLVSLDYKMLIAAIVEVVPQELTDSMSLQLVSFRNGFMCCLGEENTGFRLLNM